MHLRQCQVWKLLAALHCMQSLRHTGCLAQQAAGLASGLRLTAVHVQQLTRPSARLSSWQGRMLLLKGGRSCPVAMQAASNADQLIPAAWPLYAAAMSSLLRSRVSSMQLHSMKQHSAPNTTPAYLRPSPAQAVGSASCCLCLLM